MTEEEVSLLIYLPSREPPEKEIPLIIVFSIALLQPYHPTAIESLDRSLIPENIDLIEY